MKHHEYQIYYGGFKIKLKGIYFCKQCGTLISKNHTTKLKRQCVNHKKQMVRPRGLKVPSNAIIQSLANVIS